MRAAAGRCLLLFLGIATGARELVADERADAVGRELIAALGGEAAWQRARQLQFDFVLEREGDDVARFSHAWDRTTGDYRLTGTDKTGAPLAVYFNVKTRGGRVFVNSKSVEGETRTGLLENAYERFLNDSHWLLAPWEVLDPGVRRIYDGERPCPGGGLCDVLKVDFDASARPTTSGDVYWLWIARNGRRMVQWQYVSGGADEPPTTAEWKDWQKFDGILLSLEKPIGGSATRIRFENVRVAPIRDDALFRPPAEP